MVIDWHKIELEQLVFISIRFLTYNYNSDIADSQYTKMKEEN